ncbi:MAG: leucine--tRNA ligase [Flavobacteriales bacterium]|nr:leucine--tRNA ligase [Flavobacteriales bacterium]QQS71384.1 MAG: leucine--tRNA ligase [Flavobacteriales bacterium]
MAYDHKGIEEKWREEWRKRGTYRVENDTTKPKYYVLDMFPYPSGAGLHVGHPLGYIASDIVARFKRHSGFNVLHPMGYDSFGLPAEQYAIQTGQHPAKTTEENAARYREQLDRIGFSFDWNREVRTSNPDYYKWTQWIFLQLFDSWYDPKADKARPISELIARFEATGCQGQDAEVLTGDIEEAIGPFTAAEWKSFSERTQQMVLQHFRLAYLSDAWVNWCPALGTVLANDEVKDGVSERGGHPVERKRMPQWSMRITAYAQRLLDGLDELDWTTSMKEAQRNWIGRSEGASVKFTLTPSPSPRERGTRSEGASARAGYLTADPAIASRLMEFSKEMRKNPTEAEDKLWQVIRGAGVGAKIRRQHIIDRFIVDFVSLPKRLVIEVDGDIHDLQKEEDAARTQRLKELGFEVIRFTNDEVLRDAHRVKETIKEVLNKRINVAEEEKLAERSEVENDSPLPRRGAGGEGYFSLGEGHNEAIEVFTTRPDTLFGVSFLTLAPEHELVQLVTTDAQRAEVEAYVKTSTNRSERERQAEVDKVSGVFTGSFAKHPFTGKDIPIWVGDYVLAGYGTGAVMAVPGGDQRDWRFAKHFNLPIIAVTEGADIEKGADERKDAVICNEGFLKGMQVPDAIRRATEELEKLGAGEGRINYRLRDAAFGRQRYWGEPIPIYYKDDIPYPLPESALPLELPVIDKFQPTETGEPPLARASKWKWDEANQRISESGIDFPLETTTMPGWAGSSWYFLRYMDPTNEDRFASPEAINYWQQIDLYMGGSEHATGHLLYFRFWTKFLFDRGLIPFDEPAKKLVNQGMIQGVSAVLTFVSNVKVSQDYEDFEGGVIDPVTTPLVYVSNSVVAMGEEYLKEQLLLKYQNYWPSLKTDSAHTQIEFQLSGSNIDVKYILSDDTVVLDLFKEDKMKSFSSVKREIDFVLDGSNRLVARREVEKMSKSKLNVFNPDDIIEKYGADTLRLYEMFLGPLEQSKPWDTHGIEGTSRFLKKFWNLFFESDVLSVSEEAPTDAEQKVLHATLKKVTEDIGKMSFNTSVAQFMIAANELGALKCHKRDILEPLTIALAPFAPHIAEELWSLLGHSDSITTAKWPQWHARFLEESNFSYPISFNGKTRLQLEFPVTLSKEDVEAAVLANPEVQQRLEGKAPKKVIVVHKRIVNIVV